MAGGVQLTRVAGAGLVISDGVGRVKPAGGGGAVCVVDAAFHGSSWTQPCGTTGTGSPAPSPMPDSRRLRWCPDERKPLRMTQVLAYKAGPGLHGCCWSPFTRRFQQPTRLQCLRRSDSKAVGMAQTEPVRAGLRARTAAADRVTAPLPPPCRPRRAGRRCRRPSRTQAVRQLVPTRNATGGRTAPAAPTSTPRQPRHVSGGTRRHR
jgi:hypothetical protein